jgi:hypothetical protein
MQSYDQGIESVSGSIVSLQRNHPTVAILEFTVLYTENFIVKLWTQISMVLIRETQIVVVIANSSNWNHYRSCTGPECLIEFTIGLGLK